MPNFGIESKKNLATAHQQLQELFEEVVKYFDCKVLYGHRTPEEQFELYKKGRKLVNGKWIIADKSKVVTYLDGITKLSNHNTLPSTAVDVVPYTVDWKDLNRFYMFIGFVRAIAITKGIKIRSGGDWDGDTQVKDETFIDLAHFELIL